MESLLRDIRYGLRTLTKSPGFTAVVTIILALGVGATTAMFTMVNGIFLKPIPVPDGASVVSIYTTDSKNSGFNSGFLSVSGPNYEDFRDENEVFTDLAAYSQLIYNIGNVDEPVQVLGEIVTGNYFDVLGIKPQLGRFFLPEEDRTPGTHPVVVLSDAGWRNSFGRDPGIIGSELSVNGAVLTVIGVAEKGFEGLGLGIVQELWVPKQMYQQVHPTPDFLDDRRAVVFNVVGRLKDGVTIDQAEANMQAIATALEEQYPEPNDGRNVILDPLSRLGPGFRDILMLASALLVALAGLVLLIASANIANLLLVRAASRKREIAVRISLGAGRTRLIRQLLTESFVLSAMGGALGLVLALWLRDLLWSFAPPLPFQIGLDMSLDARVLGFTAFISMAGGLFFGLVPAIQSSRPDLSSELKSGHQREGSIRKLSARNILVIAQVSLSLVALVSAGLLMRSFQNTLNIPPGFRTENILTVSFSLIDNRYLNETTGQSFFNRLQEEVQALPGVNSADVGSNMPFFFGGISRTVYIEGRDADEGEDGVLVATSTVGPDYLRTMDIPVLRGRDFRGVEPQESSIDVGPQYSIINETMAERFWPGEDALGRRYKLYGDVTSVEVIGIAKDVKYGSLSETPTPAFMYLPLEQSYRDARATINLFVHTAGPPASLGGPVQEIFRRLDPNLPLTGVRPMTAILDQSMWLPSMGAWLVAAFGALALLLAAIGVYGVISFSVSQRTHEIGLRMALGAKPTDAMALVVRQGLILTMIGVVVGIVLSLAVTRVLATFLVGIEALDPTVFGVVAIVLTIVAGMASYLPALRATKIDPVSALRTD